MHCLCKFNTFPMRPLADPARWTTVQFMEVSTRASPLKNYIVVSQATVMLLISGTVKNMKRIACALIPPQEKNDATMLDASTVISNCGLESIDGGTLAKKTFSRLK